MSELRALESVVRQTRDRFYGKYRGFVVNNEDPAGLGRVQLLVPSVLGEEVSAWALPCTPYGGAAAQGMLMVPPIDAQVIAEFMEGDISAPIWTGTFWRDGGEMPEDYAGSQTKVLATASGHRLLFDDRDDETKIRMQSANGAEVLLDQDGNLKLTDESGAVVHLDAAAKQITIEDANGNSMVMRATGTVLTDANGNTITCDGAGVEVAAPTITLKGNMAQVGGAGGEPIIKGMSFMTFFNSHTHLTTLPGMPTTPPTYPMLPTFLTGNSVAK